RMEDQEIIDYFSVRKVDQKIYPFRLVNQENEVLLGFLWKPEDRPKSVQDMLSRTRVKRTPIVDSLKSAGDSSQVISPAIEDFGEITPTTDSIQTKAQGEEEKEALQIK